MPLLILTQLESLFKFKPSAFQLFNKKKGRSPVPSLSLIYFIDHLSKCISGADKYRQGVGPAFCNIFSILKPHGSEKG
jgi:hypothetical protein